MMPTETPSGVRSDPLAQEAIDPLRVLRESGLFDAAWYLNRYPDLEQADIDLLQHYHHFGWKEGRQPNLYFDPHWYQSRRPDVKAAGLDPLLHYVLHGEAEGEQPCPLFDPQHHRACHDVPPGWLALRHYLVHRRGEAAYAIPEFDAAWYMDTYPDIAAAGVDPLEHYLVQGFREGRQPSPDFDTRYYRQRYLRGAPDMNPLVHYLEHKGEPGLYKAMPTNETTPYREARRFSQAGPLAEPVRALPAGATPRVTALAFYLPQFHPIPENDAWWGEGFTEWTNLGRAMPRFAGHYQPRIPRDLGHYRLDGEAATRDVLARQIALAKGAGIGGFVFYFYWFNGRRLLERPVETLLADKSLAMPFCLMWANENWSRRWDGSEDDVLLAQDYAPEDDEGLVAAFVRHFADTRYIRVGGRPLLMVYRPRDIPDAPATVARWRAMFREAHGEDPLFVMAQSFDDADPRPFGMDGAVEFPPHKLTQRLPTIEHRLDLLDPDLSARVYDYEALTRASLEEPAPDYPLIKTAVPSWDNDPRRQGAGMVLHGSTPALYERWMEGLVSHARANRFHGEAIVCVNAWNEWAEGAYLEPDMHFGAAYLNATGRALAGLPVTASQGRLLLVGHDAFEAGAQRLLLAIGSALRSHHGIEVAFLLLGGGALLPAYQAVATTVVADGPALAQALASLRDQGFARAIVNSAASGRAAAALDTAGIGFVFLAHELPGLLRQKGLEAAAGEASRRALAVVFASEAGAEGFGRVAAVEPSRMIVLPQGLYAPPGFSRQARMALRAGLGLDDDAVLALGMGYGDLRKGFDLFLQSWRLAQAEGRRVHFAWAGTIEPALRTAFAADIETALATGRFHLPGQVASEDGWYSAADVFVLSSREDPYPSVAIEALSAGLPVVAFAGTGGIPGLLEGLGAGAVVPFGDCLALGRQMLSLAGRRDEATARAVLRRFDFGVYVSALLRLALPERLSVAAVVPSYNYGRYMQGRLRSLFAQTYPVESIAVIDDASDDDSVAVARATAAASGRVVAVAVRRRNSGSVFKQWRRAANACRSEWLWIAEADDLAEPRFLERLAAAISSAGDGVVMGFTDSRAIDAEGAILMPSYQPYYRQSGASALSRDGIFEGADFVRSHLSARNLILNASAVLWRRDALLAALDRCRGELDEYRMAGDWRVYVEVLGQPGARVAYVAEALNAHRRHGASVTGRLAAGRHVEEIRRVQQVVASRQPVCARAQAAALHEAALAVAAE